MGEIISQTLYGQVFEHMKDLIRSGALKQGDLLPGENALAQRLGVSRVTVRRALKQLSEAGIIQTHKGKGSFVAVDWRGLLEKGEMHDRVEEYQRTFLMSTQARRVIEPAIARQAAAQATPEDLARLEQVLEARDEQLVLAPLLGRPSKLVDFHSCMWECLHNPVVMRTWEQLAETSAVVNRLPIVLPTHREEQMEQARRQHRNIFEAIKRRDGEYAYLYMMVHCDWIMETYGQYFENFLH